MVALVLVVLLSGVCCVLFVVCSVLSVGCCALCSCDVCRLLFPVKCGCCCGWLLSLVVLLLLMFAVAVRVATT